MLLGEIGPDVDDLGDSGGCCNAAGCVKVGVESSCLLVVSASLDDAISLSA